MRKDQVLTDIFKGYQGDRDKNPIALKLKPLSGIERNMCKGFMATVFVVLAVRVGGVRVSQK